MQPIRLRCSGNYINPRMLPSGFIDAFSHYIDEEDDTLSILAVFAYVFCGKKITDLRDHFILSDRMHVRKASREYIRQKVIFALDRIRDEHVRLHGTIPVSLESDHEHVSSRYLNRRGVSPVIIHYEGDHAATSEITQEVIAIITSRVQAEDEES